MVLIKVLNHFVDQMALLCSLLSHLSSHLSYFIWTLLLETWSLDLITRFLYREEDGTTRTLTASVFDTSAQEFLGSQITGRYWDSHSQNMQAYY